jgi:FixJ family two-component response regulator
MSVSDHRIYIIDDDESVKSGLSLLLKSAGYPFEAFSSGTDFIENVNHTGTGCIILDVFLDDESGLELQDRIQQLFPGLPIIYISGQGDVPMSVRALKKGAVNFLQKPIDEEVLFQALDEALSYSAIMVDDYREIARIRSLVKLLTTREKEIFLHITRGLLNKQIASELRIAEHTVKLHRGNITKKLGVKSVAELVRMAERIQDR